MEYGSDEYWEARRAELRRAKNRREFAKLLEATMQALAALIAIGLLVWFCFQVAERPVNERAAWLEGDGLDPATARALARQGYGKTAAEVVGEGQGQGQGGRSRSTVDFGDLRPAALVGCLVEATLPSEAQDEPSAIPHSSLLAPNSICKEGR